MKNAAILENTDFMVSFYVILIQREGFWEFKQCRAHGDVLSSKKTIAHSSRQLQRVDLHLQSYG